MRLLTPLRLALIFSALAATTPAQGVLDVTRQVDLTPGLEPAAGLSRWASISADGSHVIFSSFASDLVPGDTNLAEDIFLRDLSTGAVTRLSVAPDGTQVTSAACRPTLSGDGRYALFECEDDCLVPGDTNGASDVFVRDVWTGAIQRASLGNGAVEADGLSCEGAISQDGRWVVFASEARNLGGPVAPGSRHIYLRDLLHQRTKLISGAGLLTVPPRCERPSVGAHGMRAVFAARDLAPTVGVPPGSSQIYFWDGFRGGLELVSASDDMRPADQDCLAPKISDDGAFAVFESRAANLVEGDTNGFSDIFLRDLVRGETHRISLTSTGEEPNGDCFAPSISADGRHVVFTSDAKNLAAPGFAGDGAVFVVDLKSKLVQQVSVSSYGEPSNATSMALGERAISADGRYVAFDSAATNLVAKPTAPGLSVFVRDRVLVGVELEVLADTIGCRLVAKARGVTDGGLVLFGLTEFGQGPTPSPLGLFDLTPPVMWYVRMGNPEQHANLHLPLYWGLYGKDLYMQAVDITTLRPSNARVVSVE